MEDQYGMPDLRQYISGRPMYPLPPPPQLQPPPELLLTQPNPYDMLVFRSDSNTNNSGGGGGGASSSAAVGGGFSGFEMSGGGGGRWPRQETLTLLEIRSRLDTRFKEANQKGPLWDEVSRLMSEENGYQRSGKKCREKFENLYKYYKKTKGGKAGRQDGKHYRFFRQLEALYGETNNSASASNAHLHYNYPNKNTCLPNYNNQDSFPGSKISDTSLSLSNLSDSDTTSSDDSGQHHEGIDDNDSKKKKKRSKRGWKIKIKDFIDGQMKKLIDKQEIWMEKIMKTIEQKEQERILREEECRKQDAARIEMEHKLWATERAWIEARDSALMEAFHKMAGKEIRVAQQETMAPDIRSHDSINKKRKENSKGLNYFQNHHESICNIQGTGGGYCDTSERGGDYAIRLSEQGGDHTIRLNNDHVNSNPNGNNSISDSCFRYFMGDGFGRIMD